MLFFSLQRDLDKNRARAVNHKTGRYAIDRNINASRDDNCRFKCSDLGASCRRYTKVKAPGDESALQEAVTNEGPVSVAIDAEQDFQFYESGGFWGTFLSL